MGRKLTYLILLLFVVGDLSYSFLQFYHQPLDGDMGWNIVPAESVEPIFEDPLGIKALTNDTYYPNPNRYFAQLGYREYMLTAPVLLQNFSDPITSVYLSCALAKTITLALVIAFMAMLITGSTNLRKLECLVAAAMITPFFQTNGYHHSMGIIDSATTYTFFYALAIVPVLIFFLPLIRKYFHGSTQSISTWKLLALICLSLVIALSGPLNTGIVLVVFAVLFSVLFIRGIRNAKGKNLLKSGFSSIPKELLIVGIPACLFSAYSLLLGTHNSISVVSDLDLASRYALLPEGLWNLLSQKIGLPLLLTFIVANGLLIRRFSPDSRFVKALPWLGVFCLLYVLLLPLGGFRDYRPLIIRYDTMMPVMLVIFFLFGISTLELIKAMKGKFRKVYLTAVIGLLALFTVADEPEFDNKECERRALNEIATALTTPVALHPDCPVIGWTTIDSPEESKWNSKLLLSWGICKDEKRYYHMSP